MRYPYHRIWDMDYQGCGCWGCCTDYDRVRAILEVVAWHLPHRDARRFRALAAAIDEQW